MGILFGRDFALGSYNNDSIIIGFVRIEGNF